MSLVPKTALEKFQRHAIDFSGELHPETTPSHKAWLLAGWELYIRWLEERSLGDHTIGILNALHVLGNGSNLVVEQVDHLRADLTYFFVLLQYREPFFKLKQDEMVKAEAFLQVMYVFLNGKPMYSRVEPFRNPKPVRTAPLRISSKKKPLKK